MGSLHPLIDTTPACCDGNPLTRDLLFHFTRDLRTSLSGGVRNSAARLGISRAKRDVRFIRTSDSTASVQSRACR